MAEGSSWLVQAEVDVRAGNLSAVGDAAEQEASRVADLLRNFASASQGADARAILAAYKAQVEDAVRLLEGLGGNVDMESTVSRLRSTLETLVRTITEQFETAFEDLARQVGGGGGDLAGGRYRRTASNRWQDLNTGRLVAGSVVEEAQRRQEEAQVRVAREAEQQAQRLAQAQRSAFDAQEQAVEQQEQEARESAQATRARRSRPGGLRGGSQRTRRRFDPLREELTGEYRYLGREEVPGFQGPPGGGGGGRSIYAGNSPSGGGGFPLPHTPSGFRSAEEEAIARENNQRRLPPPLNGPPVPNSYTLPDAMLAERQRARDLQRARLQGPMLGPAVPLGYTLPDYMVAAQQRERQLQQARLAGPVHGPPIPADYVPPDQMVAAQRRARQLQQARLTGPVHGPPIPLDYVPPDATVIAQQIARANQTATVAGNAAVQDARARARAAAPGAAGPAATPEIQQFAKVLTQARSMGVTLPFGATLESATVHRLQHAVTQYGRLSGRGVSTEGMNLTQVEATLQEIAGNTRRGAAGHGVNGEPAGFFREFLGASTAGIGGYRSASRLPPGALAGNALGVLGRGAAGGLAFNAFFALQGGMQMAISSAMQLDRQLAMLKDTLQGVTGSTSQWTTLRENILNISDATGVAGSDVAQLAQQFLGLTNSATAASNATRSAAQFIAITGTTAQTVGPEFATIMQNAGLSGAQIGNAAVTAGNRAGRTPADILQGVAQFAPVGSEFGLSGNQMFGLVAATARGSAMSGTNIGESLGRILENLPSQISAIERESAIRFKNPANAISDLRALVSSGRFNYAVTQTLGGERNANVLAALQQDPQALRLLSGNYTNNNALAQRNAAVQATLSASFERLKTAAESLANRLIASGVGQTFNDIVSAGASVVSFLGTIAHGFEMVDNALGGVPARIAEFTLLIGGLNRLGAFDAIKNIGNTVSNLRNVNPTDILGGARNTAISVFGSPAQRTAQQLGRAEANLAVLQERLTTATDAQRIAIQEQIAAEEERIQALRGDTVATTENTAAVARQAETNATSGAANSLGGAEGAASRAGGLLAAVSDLALPATIAATVSYAVGSAMAHAGNQQTDRRISEVQSALQNLSPSQLATVAHGGTVRVDHHTITGSNRSLGVHRTNMQGTEHFLSYFNPVQDFERLFGVARRANRYGTLSPSARSEAARLAREQQFAAGAGSGVNANNVQTLLNASGLTSLQVQSLQAAMDAFQKSGTAGHLRTLQSVYRRLSNTSGGRQALQAAAEQRSQTNAYNALSRQYGLTFQSTSDISTAFQSGLLNVPQAEQAFRKIIASDNAPTAAGREQLRADQAALSQFVSDQLTQALSDQIAAGSAILGQTPGQAFQQTIAALKTPGLTSSARVQLANQAVQEQSQQLAYQMQMIGISTPSYLQGESIPQQYMSLITGGGAPVSASAAAAINAALLRQNPSLTASQLPYQNVARYQQQLSASQHYQQQLATTADRLMATSQRMGRPMSRAQALNAASGQLGAAPTVGAAPSGMQTARLNPQQQEQAIQGMQSYYQDIAAQQVANAQLAGASPVRLAQIQQQGDQRTLAALQAADRAAHFNSPSLNTDVIQAETKVTQDTYNAVLAQVQNIQAIANVQKTFAFANPVQQAQIDIGGAQRGASSLHTTISALETQLQNGTISSAGLTVLNEWAQGQQELFQGIQSSTQAQIQLVQAQNAANPLQAAQQSMTALTSEADKLYGSMAGLQRAASNPNNVNAINTLSQITQQQFQAFQASQANVQGYYNAMAAQYTAIGNTPAAAQQQLEGARAALQAFQTRFPTDANLQNSQFSQLYQAFQQAQGNYLNTVISYGTNLLQEEVQNNQISIGQEIQQLRVLQQKAAAAGNKAQVEALQTQIQQAINQGNQNAAFDLPSNINIPTLYEVRRTEATRGGNNYYGNQGTVNVNINIGNGVNSQQAVNAITRAVGGPPTVGNNLPIG